MSDLEASLRRLAGALDEAAPTITPDEAERYGNSDRPTAILVEADLDRIGRRAGRSRQIGSAVLVAAAACLLVGVLVWRDAGDRDTSVVAAPPRELGTIVVIGRDGRVRELGLEGGERRFVGSLPTAGPGSPADDPNSPTVLPDGQVLVTVNGPATACGLSTRIQRLDGRAESITTGPSRGPAVATGGTLAYVATDVVANDGTPCHRELRVRPDEPLFLRWQGELSKQYQELVARAAQDADPDRVKPDKDRLLTRGLELERDHELSFRITDMAVPPVELDNVGIGSDGRWVYGTSTAGALVFLSELTPLRQEVDPSVVTTNGGFLQPRSALVDDGRVFITWDAAADGRRSVSRYDPATAKPMPVGSPFPSLFEVPTGAGAIRAVRPDATGRRFLVIAEHETFLWDGSALQSLGTEILSAAWAASPSPGAGAPTTVPSPTSRPSTTTSSSTSVAAPTTAATDVPGTTAIDPDCTPLWSEQLEMHGQSVQDVLALRFGRDVQTVTGGPSEGVLTLLEVHRGGRLVAKGKVFQTEHPSPPPPDPSRLPVANGAVRLTLCRDEPIQGTPGVPIPGAITTREQAISSITDHLSTEVQHGSTKDAPAKSEVRRAEAKYVRADEYGRASREAIPVDTSSFSSWVVAVEFVLENGTHAFLIATLKDEGGAQPFTAIIPHWDEGPWPTWWDSLPDHAS